jgi:hypothetical protein
MALGPRVLDHHVVLWLGDLNYRLNLPEDAIVGLLRHKKLDLLKEFDQVCLASSPHRLLASSAFRLALPSPTRLACTMLSKAGAPPDAPCATGVNAVT